MKMRLSTARILTAIAAPLVLGILLLLAAGGGISVGQSGYETGFNISPSSACVGSNVTLSGTLPPGSNVSLSMYTPADYHGTGAGPAEKCGSYGSPCGDTSQVAMERFYRTVVGNTTAGPDGSWALTFRIPAIVESELGGTDSTPTGVWKVIASGSGGDPYTQYSPDYGTLTVLDCSGSLPATGFPRPLAVIIAGLVSSAGIGLVIASRRSRSF